VSAVLRRVAGHRGAAWWVVGAAVVAALLTWLLLTPEQVEASMGETGFVEPLTAATYALCAVAIWMARRPGDDVRSVLALATVLTAFCLREMDWHKAFTGTSVLRLSWYAGDASWHAKAIAATAVLLFAAALGWLASRHAAGVWRDWRRGDAVATTVLAFVVVLVVAKSLDRSVSLLTNDLGVPVPLRWVALRSALEEWLELALSMLVLLGLVQHRHR
jgi:hypothetical protein